MSVCAKNPFIKAKMNQAKSNFGEIRGIVSEITINNKKTRITLNSGIEVESYTKLSIGVLQKLHGKTVSIFPEGILLLS